MISYTIFTEGQTVQLSGKFRETMRNRPPGKGPFTIQQAERVKIVCKCGLGNDVIGDFHPKPCLYGAGHPQSLTLVTAQGEERISGAWLEPVTR